MPMKGTFLIGHLFALLSSLGATELRFAKIFTDHGVLQRDMPVHVWGWSGPNTQVKVEFGGQTKNTTADESGKWMIKLDPMKANARGQELKVTAGGSSVSLEDILVGEVWLASGQSNMGFSIPKSTHAEEARKLIPHPTLRRFKVGPYIADEPLADIGADGAFQHPRWRMGDDGQWRTVDNERFGLDWISAVAAWFAHEVRISQDVPVGLIESNFGGSKLYCWMPRESLDHSPEFTRDVIELYRVQKAKWDESYAAWEADPNRDPDKPPTEPWRLSCLYNAMIAPVTPYAMRGVIWYQGESNQGRAEAYRRQLPTMVTSWRKAFHKNDLAFLAVQLPAFGKVRNWPRSAWSEMRESIALLEKSLPYTATVVSTDCGLPDEIHPPLKKPIGQRLALAARAKVYGEKDLISREPRPRKITFLENTALIDFDQNLETKDGQLEVKGFSLAGLDQKFHPAKAMIKGGGSAWVTSEKVKEPIAVRYAWQDSPISNLQNKEGMPVGTFRSDVWKLMTQARITTPLMLKESGTPEKPEVFDGQGMFIDLGTRVSDHDWIINADLWTSLPDFLKSHGREPRCRLKPASRPRWCSRKAGTPKKPEIFDGQGMLIDLGTRVSEHDWIINGDLWTSRPDFLRSHGHEPRIAGQTAGLFIGEIPITIPRDHEAEKGRPEMKSKCYFALPTSSNRERWDTRKDGSLYFRWPKGCKPGKATGADRGSIRSPSFYRPKTGSTACPSPVPISSSVT